jgi:hypothetical protein
LESDPWRQWQAFASQFASMSQAAQPADAMLQFSDFLREQFADLWPLWAQGFGAGKYAASASPGPSMMSLPALGAMREQQQRGERMLDAWQRALGAQRRLQRLWGDALREAAIAFTTRLGAGQPRVLDAEALRELYHSWIDCAEDAYARTAHGDAFTDALADFVNASSLWRRELNASIEDWSKWHDLPTRSEVNTLTRRLRALEDQLKQLNAAPGKSSAARAEGKRRADGAKRPGRSQAAKRAGRSQAARRKAKQ